MLVVSMALRSGSYMAFRLRVKFSGALYYVINRGNYRAWIFHAPAPGPFSLTACSRRAPATLGCCTKG
jgi:hypothetical protein